MSIQSNDGDTGPVESTSDEYGNSTAGQGDIELPYDGLRSLVGEVLTSQDHLERNSRPPMMDQAARMHRSLQEIESVLVFARQLAQQSVAVEASNDPRSASSFSSNQRIKEVLKRMAARLVEIAEQVPELRPDGQWHLRRLELLETRSEQIDAFTLVRELEQTLLLVRQLIGRPRAEFNGLVRHWLLLAGATVDEGEPIRITMLIGVLADAVPVIVASASERADESVVDRLVQATIARGPRACGYAVALLIYQAPPDALAQIRIRQAHLRDGVIVIPIPAAAVERSLVTPGAPAALLAEYAERYLPGASLFDDRNAVADMMMFYGRSDLLERLSADLVRCQGVGLFGLRKSGKTSTLLQLVYRLREHPVVHVDLQRHSGSNQFGSALLAEILGQLNALLAQRDPELASSEWPLIQSEAPVGHAVGSFVERFNTLAERLSQAGYKLPIMCFLDEIERLLPMASNHRDKADEFNATFGALRALSQEQRQIAMLVADVHPDVNRVSRWPQGLTGTNPLYSFFKEVFLDPFSEAETVEMLDGLSRLMGWGFEAKTAQAVHRASGGHPFLSRQLASLLCDRLSPLDGDTVTWTAAARYLKRPMHFSGSLKDYFGQNIWADLERRGAEVPMAVLRLLADSNGPSLTDADLASDLAGRASGGDIIDALLWLEAVGLVSREEGDETDRYRLRVPLLGAWLKLQFGAAVSAVGPAQ